MKIGDLVRHKHMGSIALVIGMRGNAPYQRLDVIWADSGERDRGSTSLFVVIAEGQSNESR